VLCTLGLEPRQVHRRWHRCLASHEPVQSPRGSALTSGGSKTIKGQELSLRPLASPECDLRGLGKCRLEGGGQATPHPPGSALTPSLSASQCPALVLMQKM
jgi:hypothetical protein